MKGIKQLIKKVTDLITQANVSIRMKLLTGFLLIGTIPLLAIGGITYNAASNALMNKAEANLRAIGQTKATAIETFFDERRADMDVLHEIVFTMQQKAFEKLVSVRDNKIIWVEDYLYNRLGDIRVLSVNPNMAGAIKEFAKAGKVNSPGWNSVAKKYKNWLTEYKETFGYYNLFLVNANGNVMYTVEKESDLGQNLKWGRLKTSPAAKAFWKGLKKVTLQDFEAYEPLSYQPAAFISAPVKSGGKVVGVVMGQLHMDHINGIMQERAGLSNTTEAYLFGKVKH